MLASKNLAYGFVFASIFTAVACSAPAHDDDAGTTAGSSASLTADSLGVVCRTLGAIGQCTATSLCAQSSQPTCKAKASALVLDPGWADMCNRMSFSEQACGWQSDCYWDTTSVCAPTSTKMPSVGAPDLVATCSALGELGACARVPACKSATEGVCQATDDAIALDPQWQQMCPRAGTSEEACEAESNCTWNLVNTCTPRATGTSPIDVPSACKTLGQVGACGTVSVCSTVSEGQCLATASALASSQDWARLCLANNAEQSCGWQMGNCSWQAVDQCVAQSGPQPSATVDIPKACDTLGQIGQCSRAPLCKPVAQGHCRATANALAGDPDWANQCPRAGGSPDTCGFLAPNCVWDTSTSCVPK